MGRRFGRAGALGMALVLTVSAVAVASDADTAVADTTAPTNSVELSPGDNAAIIITVTVSGRQDHDATFEVLRDWTLAGGVWTGSNPVQQVTPPRAFGAGAPDPYVYNFNGNVSVDEDQECSPVVDDELVPFNLAIKVEVIDTESPGALSARDASDYDVFVVGCDDDPAYTIDGFYQPVQNAVVNGAKAGRVIPLKFNILDEDGVKQSDTELVDVFVQRDACNGGAEHDLLTTETLSSGKTELRWDPVAEQMVFNWKTPKAAGCYRILLEVEGDSLSVDFNLS